MWIWHLGAIILIHDTNVFQHCKSPSLPPLVHTLLLRLNKTENPFFYNGEVPEAPLILWFREANLLNLSGFTLALRNSAEQVSLSTNPPRKHLKILPQNTPAGTSTVNLLAAKRMVPRVISVFERTLGYKPIPWSVLSKPSSQAVVLFLTKQTLFKIVNF